MATKERFSNKKFCAAWNKHGPQSIEWNEFVTKMRKAAGNPHYSEDEIRRRIGEYEKVCKGKTSLPYYPKKRRASALVFFQENAVPKKETSEQREKRLKAEAKQKKSA